MPRLLVVLFISLIFSGCNLINPDEKEPTFLVIPEYSFNTNPAQGTNSEKFTEMWVYVNDNILSITDVPAVIPIVTSEPVSIMVWPGIKNNGISTSRIYYTPVEPQYFTLQPKPLQYDTIRPVFRYWDDLIIRQSDFDASTPSFVAQSANQGQFSIVTDDALVFEGSRSGLLKLEQGQDYLSFKMEENFDFTPGQSVFLELNYSASAQFNIGVISMTSGNPVKDQVLIVNPTTADPTIPTWNKIYVDLGLVVQQNPNASYYELFFEMFGTSATRPVSLYLDNIKTVTFP